MGAAKIVGGKFKTVSLDQLHYLSILLIKTDGWGDERGKPWINAALVSMFSLQVYCCRQEAVSLTTYSFPKTLFICSLKLVRFASSDVSEEVDVIG